MTRDQALLPSHPPAAPASARRAFTLVEMTVSLGLVSLVMAACGSMVFVAAKALANDKSNVGSDAVAARAAADQIVDDLKVATAVTEQTATAVTMTVPDRDGDGQPETIRYAWSGTPGDPLLRTYNARPAGAVATNVRALNFTYLTKQVGKPPPVESAEQTLATHNSTVTANYVGYQLTSSSGAAEMFAPTLASTAIGWKPTRCRVLLQRSGLATGTVTVSVKYADAAKKPTGAALCSGTALILSVLGSGYNWVDVAFTSTPTLDVSKKACLVVTYAPLLLGTGGYVYADNASGDATAAFASSTDGGSTWTTPVTTSAMQFVAWGTVTTQDPQTMTPQPLPPSSP
jgi:type II secretory pathway pseudopilin PulG